MIRITQSSLMLIMAVCVLLLMQVIGCSEDADEITDADRIDTSGAPALPPDESMIVDISAFNDGEVVIPEIPISDGEAQLGPGETPPATGKNFTNAAARVVTINAAIVSALVLPVGLFSLAKETEPVEQDDGSWLWSYNVTYEIFAIDARLTGVPDGVRTHWSMRISSENPILPVEDFEWYTGTSTETNTSGSWQFLDLFTPGEINPTVKLDWSVEVLKMNAELTIENIDTRSDYLGDVLLYSATPEAASMSYEDVSEGETWDIRYDIETGAGSITVPNYSSGEEACWDAQKQDVQCD